MGAPLKDGANQEAAMTVIGLDLHKRYITACAMTEDGEILAEQRRVPPDMAALDAFFAGLPAPLTVAMEATLYWAWLHDQLVVRGITVLAAHAYEVKLIWQARAKTDPIDARKLAELARTHLLPTVWVASPELRGQRRLLRGRAYLVHLRTSVKNRIHGHLMAENCRTAVTDVYGKAGRAWLTALALPAATRLQVDLLLEVIDALNVRIKRMDREVNRLARHNAVAEQLQTVPGIGVFGAMLMLAEIGSIARFRSSHELAAYAGLVPSTHSSGGKTTHGKVGRAGNRWLKWILIEAVQALKLAPGPIGAQYQRLLRAKGKQKATVAAARKLCCYLFWMLKEGWTYEQWLVQHHKLEVRPTQRLGTAA
ncbi:MAG: IS110 family transposase [Mycobacterium sp.]|nr:MAG: IS110 family transposase [Mycobacterium sp.]